MARKAVKEKRNKPIMLANLLVFGLLRRPQNTADIIHRTYVTYYWRQCRTFRSRLFIIWKFFISPFLISREIIISMVKMGKAAASCSGKTLLRQILEQLYLGVFYSIDSESYYLQEFYLKDGFSRARFFINKGALKYTVYSLLGQYGRLINKDLEVCSLGEKQSFSQFCCRKGINVVPILMKFNKDGSVNDYRKGDYQIKELPEHDLFCKPNLDKKGEGAEAWFWEGNGEFRNSAGDILTITKLKKRLIKLARSHFSGSYLVQPLIVPHPDLEPFRKLATPTIRLITYINSSGKIRADRAMLRFSRSTKAVVDNASVGGMVAPIDTLTGKLGPSTESGFECLINRWTIHHDNGAQIENRLIPYWKETCELAFLAHRHFLYRLVIGWDIIITSQGPVILEGNSQPGLCFLQKAHLTPLGKMDLGSALAFHCKGAVKHLYGGIIGNLDKNEESLDLYGESIWLRRLGWLRLNLLKSVHLIISGKVQGVFYRKWVQRKAEIYKVSGWIRNCSDGSVEAVFRGKTLDIEDLVNQCWLGPNNARVDSIKATWFGKPVGKGFQIIRS